MSAFSNYLEQQILSCHFRGGSLASAATLYLSLHSGDPADTGVSELPLSYGYSRAAVTTSMWNTPTTEAGGGYVCSNSVLMSFPQASTSAWGTVSWVGIWNHSSSTATNAFLYGGGLSSSRSVDSGDTFRFNAGDLQVILR